MARSARGPRLLVTLFVTSLVATITFGAGSATPVVTATDAQPAPDISKMDYTPIGFYRPGEPIPPISAAGTLDPNPSGKWVAYDTNIYESLTLPGRHPGDDSASDAPGNGGQPNGFCPQEDPTFAPWGKCADHQLEYLDYFEQQMRQILGPFGVVIHRYPFSSPGTGNRGGYLDAAGGLAYNITATVPGTDHPDESVLVSGHYDFTDSAPAAGWDSSEGHAEVIRLAKIMADYWTATGTRPAATVKFIPWDSEESGTFGSIDYVKNNIPPGEEAKVRGYFNMDPCAGAYPAFKNGNPATRTPEVLQLADPAAYAGATRDRITAFNARAERIVDEVLDNLDDTIDTPLGPQPIFVSNAEAAAGNDGKQPVTGSQRGEIVTALGGLAIFSSDYANFAAIGVPIFNLFPDYFGPHADGTPGQNDGVAILHTPRDNVTTINALTSTDPTGQTASEGWAKGMEMCAQMEGWYMLQPEMGGAQTTSPQTVAYFEALPNEAIQQQAVTFDATGSYRYANPTLRTSATDLTYSWNFGDGSTGSGRVATHAYANIGRYTATLTVSSGGSTDAMSVPVTVIGSSFTGPNLHPIEQADAADGDFGLAWDFSATRSGFDHFTVQESSNVATLFADDAEAGPEANWTVAPAADPNVQPWQASDSSTPKLRQNQARSGQRSFWTGLSPNDFNPGGQNAVSILTLKTPIRVPAGGDPQLAYWSLFQNEGDDQGRVEVALTDGTTVGDWMAVDVIQATNTAAGQTDPDVCDPSNPDTLSRGFESRHASLAAFAGKILLVRFLYLLGAENRTLSQPCGWYVDDISIQDATFTDIGTTGAQTFDVRNRLNGTYGYRVVGVYTDGVATAPSNIETAAVTNGSRPDLVVANATTNNNKAARDGDKVTITATVANAGNSSSISSRTEFVLDGSTVLGTVDTPSITAGGSRLVSVQWDTRGVKGDHVITITADRAASVAESNEANNGGRLTVTVQGNKVKNGSFEQPNQAGSGPADWSSSNTGAGQASWATNGTSGRGAAISGTGGNAALAGTPRWTSSPIAVSPGQDLTLRVSVNVSGASSAPTAGLAYLGPTGTVLSTVSILTGPLTTAGYQVLDGIVTVPSGVASVRIVLVGFSPTDTATAGTVTFDDVGLYGP